jgi:hypothetical protein
VVVRPIILIILEFTPRIINDRKHKTFSGEKINLIIGEYHQINQDAFSKQRWQPILCTANEPFRDIGAHDSSRRIRKRQAKGRSPCID